MTEQTAELYDAVVIGAGPAGLAAGMYTARQGLRTAIIAGEVGGQAAWAGEVDNYPGWRLITGKELVSNFRDHVAQFGVECLEGRLVNAIVPIQHGFEVYTREGDRLAARAIVIATGKAPNRLAVPGERELVGRGVSYCATCDAAFFSGADVAVVGPGESAADAALALATLGARVTLISEKPVKAPEAMLDRVRAASAISCRTGVEVSGIEGEERVTGIRVTDPASGVEELIPVSGVFIEGGAIAVSEFTAGLVDLNENGEIIVDKRGATSVPGIYAAGDVTDTPAKQIIVAAGSGALAAMSLSRDLKRE